jgi:transcriptional regulator with XRE-family HTH domain
MSSNRYEIDTIKIKKLLLDRNQKKIKDLAHDIGESRAAVSQVINGLRPNDRIKKKIARYFGIAVSDLSKRAS